jgi:hypothetical protein
MMVPIEGEGRKSPQTNEDRAILRQTMLAYTGMYRIEGDKWITKVDVSWNAFMEWDGTGSFFQVGRRPFTYHFFMATKSVFAEQSYYSGLSNR